MELVSALYRCQVMHHRLSPKKHHFAYQIFMFWIDIDNLKSLQKGLHFFSYNKSNFYQFNDKDHFISKKISEPVHLNVREKLNLYLTGQGITELPKSVFLLTHVRMFGHVFNPVSFYYCYDQNNVCRYIVVEISNTFREMKLFLIKNVNKNRFEQIDTKFFYVSPFTELDEEFIFKMQIPDNKLNIQIHVQNKQKEIFFLSTLTGKKQALTNNRLLRYLFRFPFITIKILISIHWQAFLLWLKKVPYHNKGNHPELQKDIINR